MTAIAIGVLILMGLIGGKFVAASTLNFPYASIRDDCAPWDGAAVTIRLSQRPDHCQFTHYPAIEIRLWMGRNELMPKLPASYSLPSNAQNSQGVVILCDRPNHCQTAQSSRIWLDAIYPDTTAKGSYSIQVDGKNLEGHFHTEKWCTQRVLCG
ncbi:hypothetical protein DO97_19130 [Neosynechococcus sphagnicola sy1]|uniref:Uncharacterized protein n=2 Tax=Neosynechococcus TaxID=1501143 RepID=A0A098TMW7_9CYAN|nr:hypothetical protein DO97_19130 [Neosynechococcus sphagnicola sy1]